MTQSMSLVIILLYHFYDTAHQVGKYNDVMVYDNTSSAKKIRWVLVFFHTQHQPSNLMHI